MVPPGGSATLYGVLYQLLASLHHVVKLLRVQRRGKDGPVVAAKVIVEPPEGGGDIRIELPGRRIVEQRKARTSGLPWNLREIIEKVLPDLYLDPNLNLPDDRTSYVFATEGSAGREAQAFFQRLRELELKEDPLEDLDEEDREVFLRIASAIRKRRAVAKEPEEFTHHKLRRLLSRFEIQENQHANWLDGQIYRMLLPLVDYVEDIPTMRDHLCMIILRRGTGKEIGNEFMPEDLLKEAGLEAVSLEDRTGLRRAARELLEREVARLTMYDRALDVRQRPDWPEDRQVLVLSGEMGQDTDWQLSRIAIDLARQEEGPLVVFLRSQGDAERDLQKASDLLWTHAWGRDRTIPLQRLAARWKQIHGEADRPWLVVCVDRVQSLPEAQALREAFDWERWGLRLAMAVPPEGIRIAGERPEQIQVQSLRNFTLPELREYLRRYGRAWETVPHDVRDTLRRPLLARLYTTIGSDPEWTPTREYELYEGYWRWLQSLPKQSEHPEDLLLVKRLALTLLDEEATYPWTWEQLEKAGVTDETLLRLEQACWWTRADEGVEVWHDRLLSWVLAEAIVEQRTGEDLAGRLMTCLKSERPRVRRILGYVPMDVLWLLSGSWARQDFVPDLIARLEEADAFGHRELYQNLLPTLGPRIVPGLLRRLRKVSGGKSSYLARQAAKALSAIVAKDSSIRASLPGLLEEGGIVRETAIQVLARHPHRSEIGPLWEIHKNNSLELEKSHEIDNYTARENSFAALRARLELDPEWLRFKVWEADPEADPIWELAYLLANLKNPVARSIWTEVKHDLFRKVPLHKRRSLVICIRIFDDHEEVPRLESWLSVEEDWIGDYAFRAIAWVEPDRAVALLQEVSLDNLSNDHAGSWPVVLLARRPDETRRALRKRTASSGPDFWRVADLYDWYEEQIDCETLDLLLDRLAPDVAGFSGRAEEAWNSLRRPLRLLAGIHRLDLLRAFEERAGTDLDRGLGELGAAWINGLGQHDLKALRSVLLKIGGEGLRRLIRAGLASSDPGRRTEALVWGMSCPEEVTAAEPRWPWVSAALGEDQALVQAILAFKGEIQNSDLTKLWRLRRGRSPMTDADLVPAFEALASEDLEKRTRGLAAMSVSGRADLLTRLPEWLEGLEGLERKDLQELDDRAGFLVHRLAQDNSEAVRRLAQALDPQRFPGPLVELLGLPGAEDLPDRLERHLLGRLDHFGEVEMELALPLRRFKELDASLLRAVWQYGKDDHRWNREIFWTTVARLDSEEIHEEVWSTSTDRRGFHDERSEGIAALRLLEPNAAFEIAAEHLCGTGKERVEFVSLLIDLDALQAVPLLIEQAVQERQTEVLWAIARSLRRAGPQVEKELRERLRSPEFQVRHRAVHLAGWQSPGFLEEELRRLSQDDPDRDIQWECLWALIRQSRERCVLELMDAFRRAEGTARWSYLESILELGDPRLLVAEEDPLWLGRILTEELGMLEVHANQRLQQRFAEIKRSAEQRDRDSED